jgi:hypothetical protein
MIEPINKKIQPHSGVLRHVVLFSWKEGTPADTIRTIEQAFIDLPKKIEAICDFEWGTDLSTENLAKGFTHCFLVTFKNEEDRDLYLPHPEHKAFVALAKPYIEDVLVIDYRSR